MASPNTLALRAETAFVREIECSGCHRPMNTGGPVPASTTGTCAYCLTANLPAWKRARLAILPEVGIDPVAALDGARFRLQAPATISMMQRLNTALREIVEAAKRVAKVRSADAP